RQWNRILVEQRGQRALLFMILEDRCECLEAVIPKRGHVLQRRFEVLGLVRYRAPDERRGADFQFFSLSERKTRNCGGAGTREDGFRESSASQGLGHGTAAVLSCCVAILRLGKAG